jgi:hypothetical protein
MPSCLEHAETNMLSLKDFSKTCASISRIAVLQKRQTPLHAGFVV